MLSQPWTNHTWIVWLRCQAEAFSRGKLLQTKLLMPDFHQLVHNSLGCLRFDWRSHVILLDHQLDNWHVHLHFINLFFFNLNYLNACRHPPPMTFFHLCHTVSIILYQQPIKIVHKILSVRRWNFGSPLTISVWRPSPSRNNDCLF